MKLDQLIHGKRILLASLDPENLSAAYQKWMKDPDVLKYLTHPDGNYELENLKEFVASMNEDVSNQLLGIFLKQGGQHIGNVKIGNIHPKHHRADVGIIIGDKTLWGKGYATEAIQLVIQYAFHTLKLHKLIAGMFATNLGSYRAFLKAGFWKVGCYRKHYWIDGAYCDAYLLEILHE